MASREQMQAVYDARVARYPSLNDQVECHGWGEIDQHTRFLYPYEVRLPDYDDIYDGDNHKFKGGISEWLIENLGPDSKSLDTTIDKIKWEVGGWDWFPVLGYYVFVFIDETDATAFKLRWG